MSNMAKIKQGDWYRMLRFLLVVSLVCGCSSAAKRPHDMVEELQKFTKSKPLPNNRWLNAERVIVFSDTPRTTVGPLKEKPNRGAGFMGGIMFGALGGVFAPGAVMGGLAMGAGGIAGGVVGAMTADGKDVSSEYQMEMDKKLPGFHEELKNKLEKVVYSRRGNRPVVSLDYSSKYQEDAVLKPTDTVLLVNCLSMFSFSTVEPGKHPLVVMLSWHLVTDGHKFRELNDKIEASWADFQKSTKNKHNLEELVAEQKQIMEQFDGYGTFFYQSSPHSKGEWLDDNGQMLQQEMNKGIESVVRKLAQAL